MRCAAVEQRSYTFPGGYGGEPLKPVADSAASLTEQATAIPLRGAGTFVVLLEAGQQFRARLENRKLGRNPHPAGWRLFGPEDKLLMRGDIEPGDATEIVVPATRAGMYLFEVNSRGNVLPTMLLNDHAAAAAERLAMACSPARLYFQVPASVRQFTLTLESPSPGETALVRIFRPDGQEVASIDTLETRQAIAELTVPEDQAGRAWSVTIEKASRGILEDFVLIVDKQVPGFWSLAPDRLVVPE